MSQIPRIFNRFLPQLLHMIVLPLFFFAFILIYRPFNLHVLLGGQFYGVHVTMLSTIILLVIAVSRLLYYYLPLKLNYTLYIFWCFCEVILASSFIALYLWVTLKHPMAYFDLWFRSFQITFFTLAIPYSILAISIRLYDYSYRSHDKNEASHRMRFYDVNHNLKLVVTSDTILYIAAEENYVNIFYTDNDRIKSYVLRASMKSIDELCLSNGMVRCHRSFYINPSHVKVLRKDKEGIIYAELDADDVRDIPVSKKYYNNLSELL